MCPVCVCLSLLVAEKKKKRNEKCSFYPVIFQVRCSMVNKSFIQKVGICNLCSHPPFSWEAVLLSIVLTCCLQENVPLFFSTFFIGFTCSCNVLIFLSEFNLILWTDNCNLEFSLGIRHSVGFIYFFCFSFSIAPVVYFKQDHWKAYHRSSHIT